MTGITAERKTAHGPTLDESKKQLERADRLKRPKVGKEESKTIGYTHSPSGNFSVASVSQQSKNKMIASAMKGLDRLNHSNFSDLSASQHPSRLGTFKKPSALNISSSLIDRIKKRHIEKQSEILSPKAQPALTKVEEISGNGKFLNFALSSAKNVNMFEINNYFSSPPIVDDTVGAPASITSNSTVSKRVESKVLELAKQKAWSKGEGKQPLSKSARQPDSRQQISSLQTKLASLTAMWKNKQTHAD